MRVVCRCRKNATMFRNTEQMHKIRIFFIPDPRRTPGGVLRFSSRCLIFAKTKHKQIMKHETSPTDRLFRLLETDRTLPDFPTACRRLRILPGALNEALLRECGISGEELILRQQRE